MLKLLTFFQQISEKLLFVTVTFEVLFNKLDFGQPAPDVHYDNTPMQYTAIFHGCKIDNFQMKKCDIFLIFAQNIDCGYTLEPPH